MFRKYAPNFRIYFHNNASARLILIFSELLAFEITKSNDVQKCQFMLIGWNENYFFHGHVKSIYITYLTHDSFSKKIQVPHMDLKWFWEKSCKES